MFMFTVVDVVVVVVVEVVVVVVVEAVVVVDDVYTYKIYVDIQGIQAIHLYGLNLK